LPSLTSGDMAALDVAAAFADIVGLSFVRTAADVEALHEALAVRNADTVGVILKIETRRGFENLPQILLTALRRPPAGVMVARGDLGVEIGFERMAEVQEQVLWLCEAAHLPVIWATQVLEGLTKTGMPTRGEVTDAAMSSRAECVMLNKGPYVERAVRFLDDVLARMRDHNIKKTPMLRRLKVSEGRWDAAAESTPPNPARG
jgi:pyruvate kinase